MPPTFFYANLHGLAKGHAFSQNGVRIFPNGVRIFPNGVRIPGNTGSFQEKRPTHTRQCMFKFKKARNLHGTT
jgi:hypothetical protein